MGAPVHAAARPPDALRLASNDADALARRSRVHHPNIVKLLGACVKPPKLCFVMELCGQSVFNLLHMTRTELEQKQLLSIVVRGAALARFPAAHSCR